MMLAPLSTQSILQMRQQILERNQLLQAPLQRGATLSGGGLQVLGTQNPGTAAPGSVAGTGGTEPPRFGAALDNALRQVSAIQDQATAATTAFETGQTHDLASVMIARQKASIAFEATLQARNRLISAYKDVMNMPL
jgi:flagellar hook-basal body complex protein FliE